MSSTLNSEAERKVSCKEVKEYMKKADPVVSTIEVANQFDVSHVTARSRLKELSEDGQVIEQKLHPSMAAWYLSGLSK